MSREQLQVQQLEIINKNIDENLIKSTGICNAL